LHTALSHKVLACPALPTGPRRIAGRRFLLIVVSFGECTVLGYIDILLLGVASGSVGIWLLT
jgi:hypothetical protein